MTIYTTFGKVRGSCPHAHRSLRTAMDCLRQDQRGCEKVSGYSDRDVYRIDDNGARVSLTTDEMRYLDATLDNRPAKGGTK